MDSKQFISLLKHPKELAAISFAELQTLSQQYPFASIVHTVIAKKAYTEKPHEYDVFLTKAAMHALDRKKLYYIIHNDKIAKKNSEEEVVTEPIENVVIADTISISENLTEITKEQEETPIPFVNGSFVAEEPAVEPAKETAVKVVEEQVEIVPVVKEIKEEKKPKKKKKHKKKHKEETLDANAQLSFTEWLKQINKKKATTVEEDVEEEEDDDLEEQYHAGKFEAQLHKQIASEPESVTPVPKIPADWKKTSDVKAEVKISDLAQKSIQRDDNTITETLAKILELQKHYAKAIEAYEKLSLKYPEKSSYFATRILELKKKL
jgi:hypothetical protein